jgi:two-component system sensor histidine kinase/response regulator
MGAAEHPHEGAARRAIVWVVDDSELQAELSRRALADRHDVTVFDDGATMLETLAAAPLPHLLILDWHMPDLSGLEVCRFVRETRDAAVLPILVLTATGGNDLAEAFEAGANDFVLKPFSPSELDARVTALVRNNDLHARLADAERRLRVEGEFRERFIGMLAHDLRQPLNTFVLASQTIEQMVPASKRLNSILELQRRAAGRMTRMIADLLDLTRSRPESGMPIDRRPMDLAQLAESVVDEMRMGHPTRTLRFTSKGGCAGQWDRDRLAQVCTNLIGNAIEHSSSATAPIDIEVTGEGEHVALAVTNRGTPIPANLLPHLFEPFLRGRQATHATGGVGLGLHIVEQIVRAHGGTITAASDDDATVFRATLPVEAAPFSR